MQLEKAFRLTSHVTPPVDVGETPQGHRQYIGSRRTVAEGDLLSGEAVPGGGDWLVVDPSGWAHPGIHYVLRTPDGAHVQLEATGLMEMNEALGRALAEGGSTQLEDAYIRSVFTLSSGDDRYAWVNTALFVGEAHLEPGAIVYDVYRVR